MISIKSETGSMLFVNKTANYDEVEEIDGGLYIKSKSEFKKIKRICGNLAVYSDAKLPELEEVWNIIYVNNDRTLYAPKLKSAEKIVLGKGAKLISPNLTIKIIQKMV